MFRALPSGESNLLAHERGEQQMLTLARALMTRQDFPSTSLVPRADPGYPDH